MVLPATNTDECTPP